MKKAYWIAKYKRIDDQDALGRYAEKAKKVIEAFGGKALVRGGKYATFEGENFIRTVIWEFPSYEKAIECHNSKEYLAGWDLAKNTTVRHMQVIEGFSTE